MDALNFSEFFYDIHGVRPFPWQERLVSQLIEQHAWPYLLDLPTAVGKTATIDVALFHLAWCSQHGEPWRAARRIVFVVDRRIIVDAAAERAERIRLALQSPRTASIRAVADSLLRLGGPDPLICQKLRGGMAREPSPVANPAQAAVISSTIDQVGSRLLFRGYGLSPYAMPVHAGLLGHDTLILLDEAHLGGPFSATVSAVVREQARAELALTHPRAVRLVQMSATAETTGTRFELDTSDRENPVIAERLTAPKPAQLVTCAKPADQVRLLIHAALTVLSELDTPAPAIAVIVNRVKTARVLFEHLRQEAAKRNVDIELLIGRSRPVERDIIAQRLVETVGANRESRLRKRGLIVVATQTIEVGADLDFQGMVTECASLDALRQRFGRLDRLGRFRNARAAVIGGSAPDDDPIYGAALNATWEWLNSIATSRDGVAHVDFSVTSMHDAIRTSDASALAREPPSELQLVPAYVDLLCQTSPRPAHEPDMAALLHGLDTTQADVQVVWRDDLPVRAVGEHLLAEQTRTDVVSALLEVNPPSSLEALGLPLYTARVWLDGDKGDLSLTDLEHVDAAEEASKARQDLRHSRPVWRRRAGDWQFASARDLSPGDLIVVPSVYGGCDEFGFSPESENPVRDISSIAREAQNRSPLLILTRAKLDSVMGTGGDVTTSTWNALSAIFEEGAPPAAEALQVFPEIVLQDLMTEMPWLQGELLVDSITFDSDAGESDLYAVLITSKRPSPGDLSDEDLSSSRTVPVALDDHNVGVGRRARELATAIGLRPELVETLGSAGELHDIGKADPRFQSLLRAGDETVLAGQLLAKGLRRVKGLHVELGERHEAYSVALLRAKQQLISSGSDMDPELALYLVGTHHGRGRSLMPDRLDEGTAFTVTIRGASHAFEGAPGLGALDSDWAGLFWRLNRRYGPWGLAFLEAVLRLADQLRSVEELKQDTRS